MKVITLSLHGDSKQLRLLLRMSTVVLKRDIQLAQPAMTAKHTLLAGVDT